jgi:hypothetical protein
MEYTTEYTCFPNAPLPTFGAAQAISAGVRFPAGARDYSLLHNVQTGHFSPWVQRPGREADCSRPSIAKINYGANLHSPIRLYDMVLILINHRDKRT